MSCNICMETIVDDNFTTSCNHIFHNKCMVPWMLTHNTCPCCRYAIGTESLPKKKQYFVRLLDNIEDDDIDSFVTRIDDMLDYLHYNDSFIYNWRCDSTGTFYHTIKKHNYNLYIKIEIYENITSEFIMVNSYYKKKIYSNPKKNDKWVFKKRYNTPRDKYIKR